MKWVFLKNFAKGMLFRPETKILLDSRETVCNNVMLSGLEGLSGENRIK